MLVTHNFCFPRTGQVHCLAQCCRALLIETMNGEAHPPCSFAETLENSV